GMGLEHVGCPARLSPRHYARLPAQPPPARKADAASLWPLKSREAAQARRLACSRRSEQDCQMRAPRRDTERRANGRTAAVPLLEVGRYFIGHTAHTFRLMA